MTAWVDDPDLTAPITGTLLTALADAMPEPEDIRPIVTAVGIHRADLELARGRSAWIDTVKEANRLHKMRRLVEHVRDNVPAARAVMVTVLATPRSGGVGVWYQCDDAKAARLLGSHARKAMIDRYDLGDALDELLSAAGRPILAISGEPGRGKTHSRYLLQHMLKQTQDEWTWVVLDIAEMWPADEHRSVNAREFIGELSAKLGLSRAYDDVPNHTEAKRIARELVTSMVGRLKQLDNENRMLFVDGLDRENVGDDVAVAVAHIARNIETGDLDRMRIVLTGFRGELSPAVLDILNENEIKPVGVTWVERFFEDIGEHVGRPCTLEQAQELAQRALANASIDDLATLGREVSKVAHDHFGGPQ